MSEPTFVLVHGAWHGPWAWLPVLAGLEARGHSAVTVDLPSSGDDPHTLGDLAADVAAIHATLAGVGGPVVLVGHSYGGIPVTQAAAGTDAVRHLVYVCAFMLDVGGSLMGALGGERPDWFEPTADGAALIARRPEEVFFADLDAAAAEAAAKRLRPQSAKSFSDEVQSAAWHDLPSTYILTEQDRALPPPAQEQMSGHASRVHRLPTSHSPFLSRPDAVVDLLASVPAVAG